MSKKLPGVSSSSTTKTSKITSFIAQKPLLTLLMLLALPFVLLIAFTLKGGFDLPFGKSSKSNKIVVTKAPTEIADKATSLLQKRDTAGFVEMLEQGALPDVNIVNSKGDPLLVAAATLGNTEAVKQLLMAGADVNKKNAFTQDTALLRCLYYTDNMDIARLLVYAGADINAVNNYKQSPMFLALEKQRGELVDLFLSNGVREGLNTNYLFRACAKKNYMGVLAMLKGGVNPNVADAKGNTPLIISSSLGDLDSVRDLLAYRADINAANADGNTALIYAARYNQPLVVRELLKPQNMQQVDVNVQNKQGQTALYWAASKGYVDIVKRLLAADADATLADNKGIIPYMAAKRNNRTEVLPWFEKNLIEVKNSVIEEDNAAIVAQAKAEGRDLPSAQEEAAAVRDEDIFKAAQTGNTNLARNIIAQNKGVVFNKNRQGDTPLLVAVANGQTEMIDLLLSNSARLFEASAKGNVFHIAVETQNMDLLKHLVQMSRQEGRLAMMLEYKANLKGQKQLTPLGLAALNCNKDMYDYLVSIGAKPGVKATSANMLGVTSPVDLMEKCKAKPTQAKKLTSTRRSTSRRATSRRTRKK